MLEGFNEWMVRCGLEFMVIGNGRIPYNTGDKATLNLTLLGKIQNIPASNYEVIVEPDPPPNSYSNRLRSFGPKLKLTTEISTIPGSSSLYFDQTTNEEDPPKNFS